LKKELIIIAGPNGSGKSTLAEMLLAEKHFLPFVNADTIAKGISGSSERTDISAGRMMITRINSALTDNESIAFETTLSGRTWVKLIGQAVDKGYQVTLGFIAVSSVEEAMSRVERRVLEGGHSIPKEFILRRYSRSLSMFFNVYTASTREFPKMLIAQEAVYPSDAELGQNKKYTPSKKYG